MINLYRELTAFASSTFLVIKPSGDVVMATKDVGSVPASIFINRGIDAFDLVLAENERIRFAEMLHLVLEGRGEMRKVIFEGAQIDSGGRTPFMMVSVRQTTHKEERYLLMEIEDYTQFMNAEREQKRKEREITIFTSIAQQRQKREEDYIFYDKVIEELMRSIPAEAVMIYLPSDVEENSQQLLTYISDDMARPVIGKWFQRGIPNYNRTVRPVLDREPVDQRGQIPTKLKIIGYQSQLIVPLILRNEKVGTLVMYSREIKNFSWEHIRLVSKVCDYLSIIVATEFLWQQRERLVAITQGVFAQAHDALFILDDKGHVIEMNPTMLNMIGETKLRVLPFNECVHPKYAARATKFIRRLVNGGVATVRVAFRNHVEKTYEITGNQVKNIINPTYLGVARDVTVWVDQQKYLREMNIELRQLDRMKDEFISLVSHELRSPLTVLHGNLSLLERMLKGEEKEMIETMKNNVDRLTRLVGDVLDVTKLEYGGISFKPQQINVENVVRLVRATVDDSLVKKNLKWKENINVKEVWNDSDRLTQIIINLVENAVKHTNEGGTIKLNLKKRDSWIVIKVTDSGSGMTPEQVEHIFERFYKGQENTSGVGLGLYIVQKLVDRMKGTITVNSQPESGTTFTVCIPLNLPES